MGSLAAIGRMVMAVVLVASTLTLTAAAVSDPARAECSGDANAWPAFTEVAPSAKRIFVGTVTEGLGRGLRWFGWYRVRVDETLRGPQSDTRDIYFIISGLPPTGSKACRQNRYLEARVGDVIAFAFGGRIAGVRGSIRTAAWLETRPSPYNPGIERLSLAQVRKAALELPDTATAPSDTPSASSDTTFADLRSVGIVVVIGAAVIAWLRIHVTSSHE